MAAWLFCERYGAGNSPLPEAGVHGTRFWRIRVNSMTGKAANTVPS